MKLHIFTLALDAMPFLPRQLEVFENLKCDWHWHIIEGVADNVLDTSWCKKIFPRFSRDGTTEWLNSVSKNPRISIYRRQLWHGKTTMCNAALKTIKEDCVLLQKDADEFHTAEQIDKIVELFSERDIDWMRFHCRYYVGEKIVVVGENCWSNKNGEWLRAWRFKPGMLFAKHEPPVLNGCGKNGLPIDQTMILGLDFEHYAYYYEHQVAFKEQYYGYTDAVKKWRALQANTVWPVTRLKDFLPWSGDDAGADLIENINGTTIKN
jgi:hypothetical protein